MRMQRHPKLRAKGASLHRTGRSVPTAVCHPAITHLSIPRLSPEVPGQYSLPSADSKHWARHALNWLELGYLKDQDQGAACELVQLAISRWVNKICGNLQHITFDLHASFEFPFYSDEEDGAEWGTYLRLMVGSAESRIYVMENKLGKLHAQNPDLAITALWWLGWGGARTLNVWTPWRAADAASYVWWYGTDDQKSFLEERSLYFESDLEEGGEDDEDVLGPEQWDASFPDWVNAPSEAMDVASLRSLSTSSQNTLQAEIASLVADIAELKEEGLTGTERWQLDSVYSSCVMRWNEDDPMLRLVDDFVEQANYASDSYTDLYSAENLPVEFEAFKTKVAELERAMQLISSIDRLIDKIADITL